ncbi:caspase, EACC1-associated type [Amycolatopsis sp. cmx-4-68]|uniref:caspase, EACC1-associated type n=1 Tax=Amycolatopsis sp. cmx-4-68 TaxID=2790938 RepID=UPI00397D2596
MTEGRLPEISPASAFRSPGTRVLVVGNSSHVSGSALPDVPAVAQTVRDLTDALVERCGLRPENLYGGGPLIDPADLAVLGDALTGAAAQATDLLLVYYVGHGPVSAGNELYLATHATDDPLRGLAFRALPFQAVRDALTDCPAQSVVMVLDCCFAGRAHGTFDPVASALELATFGGSYLLLSSSRDERSLAPPGERHTAFTGELLRLLREGDAAGLPTLTFEGVYEYLCRALPQRGAPAPRRQVSGRAGTLVLAPNPAARAAGTARPKPGFDGEDVADAPCPYQGLQPFTADDARFFFGRESLVAALLAKVASWAGEGGAIAVVGPSGSGKSSLLHAGLVPAVRRGELATRGPRAWSTLSLTPDRDPVRRLADRLAAFAGTTAGELAASLRADPARLATVIDEALRRPVGQEDAPERRLLIVVDQFEELFTTCPEEDERRAFVRALGAAATGTVVGRPPAVVVLGVRADFYARCMDYPELVAAFRERQVTVDAMTADRLREAIEKPAAEAGLVLKDGFTDVLLRDAGADRGEFSAGTLPLLSYALQRTWANREGRALTIAGYHAGGGVWHAVTQAADRIHDELDSVPGGRRAVRTLLLRMVRVGEGTEDTRRRVDLAALLAEHPDPVERDALVAARDALAEARLITVDGDSAQIAHEALIRVWPRLRRWIDEDRSGLLLHQELSDAASEWDRDGRHGSLLYRGPRLAAARQWFAAPGRADSLGPAERRFLAASVRARRRRAWGRVAVAALLAVALVGSVVAVWQYRTASQREALIASRQSALRADALRKGDPGTAEQLSLAAYRIAPTLEARTSLLASYATPYPTVLPAHQGPVLDVDYTPDGHILASSGTDKAIRLWDVSDPHRPARRAELPTDAPAAVALGPDGRLLAAQTTHSFLLSDISDPEHPAVRARLDSPAAVSPGIAVSPDGRTVATTAEAGAVRLWNVTDPAHPVATTLPIDTHQVNAVAFAPDSRTLATGSVASGTGPGTATVRLWDLANPAHPSLLSTRPVNSALSLAFSPSGNSLVAAGSINSVAVWDVANMRDPTGRDVQAFGGGGNGDYHSLAFGSDGRTFFAAKSTGTIDQWEITADGVKVYTELPGTPAVYSVALGPGGVVAGAAEDGAIRLWTTPAPTPLPGRIADPGSGVPGTAFSDDGKVHRGRGSGRRRLGPVVGRRRSGPPGSGRDAAAALGAGLVPGPRPRPAESEPGPQLPCALGCRRPALPGADVHLRCRGRRQCPERRTPPGCS